MDTRFSFFFLIACCMFVSIASAQDKKNELEQTKKKLESEISLTNQLLEETQKNKSLSLNELTILQSKIRQRENLVATLRKQIDNTENKLQRTSRELTQTEDQLSLLKKEYAAMITFAYKNRDGLNKLMFLFAAEDFNQAYRRMKYLQQYSDLRNNQINRINQTRDRLQAQKSQLEADKQEKTVLLEAERKQQIILATEKNMVDQAVRKISQQEKQLQQELRKKEQEAQKLQRQIEAIIADEIKKAQERKGVKTPATPDKLMNLTPEEQLLSNSFTKNKGKLPWPVERGVIASRFGQQPHPALKKVTINNNGIDIATPQGSEARAVFEGVVISVNKITPTNNAVIIRHGDYFTVYANLEQLFVKRGDMVNTRQRLGRIHTDKTEGKTEIHFEIWQGKTLLNPSLWLAD